jgi:hypothetical protein
MYVCMYSMHCIAMYVLVKFLRGIVIWGLPEYFVRQRDSTHAHQLEPNLACIHTMVPNFAQRIKRVLYGLTPDAYWDFQDGWAHGRFRRVETNREPRRRRNTTTDDHHRRHQ